MSKQDKWSEKRKQSDAAFDEWANRTESLLDSVESNIFIEDDEEVFYSGDLTEATYSMGFEMLSIQDDFLDVVMEDFPVWKVFGDLFKIKPRRVGVSQLKHEKYVPDDYEDFDTKSGEFMGDPISFIHLTLVWLSLVNQASVEIAGLDPHKDLYLTSPVRRPFGQQVGDDIVVLRTSYKFVKALRRRTDALGLKRSKIDSVSRDSATFCEQYLWKPPEGYDMSDMSRDDLFGDLLFLDTIKGSIMTGRAKVKSDGSSPFLGHANMLTKQIAYTPEDFQWKSDRAKFILWARNYRECKGITKALPQWPKIMGGLGLPVGRPPDLDDPRMTSYLPYLYRLLDGNSTQGLVLETLALLGSIWRSSNKGFVWDSLEIDVMSIASKLEIISDQEAILLVPPWLRDKGHSAIGGYLSQLGIISLMTLGEELNRRYNFLKWWMGDLPSKGLLKMRTRLAVVRHREVWEEIRKSIKPMNKPFYINSVSDLDKSLGSFTFGKFFKRDDPAIREAFRGMPSLFFQMW